MYSMKVLNWDCSDPLKLMKYHSDPTVPKVDFTYWEPIPILFHRSKELLSTYMSHFYIIICTFMSVRPSGIGGIIFLVPFHPICPITLPISTVVSQNVTNKSFLVVLRVRNTHFGSPSDSWSPWGKLKLSYIFYMIWQEKAQLGTSKLISAFYHLLQ